MQIAFQSDVHVDHSQPPFPWAKADVMVIAGDVSNSIGDTIKFLTKASKRYAHVVFVDGNHEHYSSANQRRTVSDTVNRLRDLMPENVTMLHRDGDPFVLDHITFVGCNGWYSFDADGDFENNKTVWRNEMNDCQNIGFDKNHQPMPWELAKLDAEYMDRTLATIPDGFKVIAVTHTPPHRDLLQWDSKHALTNPFYMNGFMSPLIEKYSHILDTWVCGHTHYPIEKYIHGVYCLVNARGYPMEPNKRKWEPVVFDY